MLLLAVLMLGASSLPRAQVPVGPAVAYTPDVVLYQHITERVAAGEDYYPAAAAEHREHGFQMRPFIVVRPPLFAWASARFSLEPLQIGLLTICLIAWIAAPGLGLFERVGMFFAILIGGWHALIGLQWMHEYWAGILLGISLAIYRPERWWLSIIPALVAVLLREIAVPFLCLAAAFALYQRRWAELAGWVAALATAAAFLAFHAYNVALVTLPSDATSPGWGGMVGISYALLMISRQSLLILLPDQAGQFIVALGILGWLGLRNRLGLFAFLYLAGMLLLLSTGARSNNIFWALLLFPLWTGGLVFVPRLIFDHGKSLLEIAHHRFAAANRTG